MECSQCIVASNDEGLHASRKYQDGTDFFLIYLAISERWSYGWQLVLTLAVAKL